MGGQHLRNIPIRTLRKYIKSKGLTYIRTKGGHEIWVKSSLARPVVFQSHIDPVPEFIVLNILRTIGESREDFINFLESK